MTASKTPGQPVPSHSYETKVLLVLTLIIGAIAGLVVVAFILLTERLGSRLYPPGSAAWRRILTPLAGALGTGYLLFRYFPNARGSGIPQTKSALFLRDGYISLRTVIGKFGLCSVSLASGIALGREGPSVQVGAGIASVLGRRLGLSPTSIKALVPAGASAALAAAFNTPISAVLFSLEEVMGDLHAPVLGSIVLSSATSWIVLHLLLGDEPLFHVPAYQLVHPVEFLFYGLLGLVGALVSVAFVKLLLWQRKFFLSLPAERQWYLPAAGGLTVGLLGWWHPQVLGVGYGFVGQALNGQILVSTMAVLVFLKLAATATCYASGNAGGIFGPSLFLGAMMGGAVGGLAHSIAPDYTGSVGAYALVGMGAAFAGIVRVPMTSVIMIFEITRDYSIVVPLMIANLISYFLSSKLQKEPIYEALQHQDGVHLPSGEREPENPLTVGDALRTQPQVLSAAESVRQVSATAERSNGAWPVVDEGGLRGMLSAVQIEQAMRSHRDLEPIGNLVPVPGPVERLDARNFPHLHADHSLEIAMQRIARSGLGLLPVVSRANLRELQGTLSVADLLAAYGTLSPAAPAKAMPAAIPRPLLVRISAVLVGLLLLTGFLNYFFRSERSGQAQASFQAGNDLSAQGRYPEAIEQYRRALSLSHSIDDRQALAQALTQAGQTQEAATYWREVLRDRPQSGPANLGMARVLARQKQIDDADVRYQRAASVAWPENTEAHHLAVRFEQADMLAQAGRSGQAQAVLESLAAQPPSDAGSQRQIAARMTAFGMWKDAAGLFREVARRNPRDAAAYAGLGDAQFGQGDYAAAREAYRSAARLDPSNAAAVKRAQVCDRVLALDPNRSGLTAAERSRRSRELLRQAVDSLSSCINGARAAKGDLQNARSTLARRNPPASLRAAESNFDLARRLWAQRLRSCSPKPPADDPVSLVMAKLPNR